MSAKNNVLTLNIHRCMPGLVHFSAIAIRTPLAHFQLWRLVSFLNSCLIFTLFSIPVLYIFSPVNHTCHHRVQEPPRSACDVCDSIISDPARRWRQIARTLIMTKTLRRTRSLYKISRNREMSPTSAGEAARGPVSSHDNR